MSGVRLAKPNTKLSSHLFSSIFESTTKQQNMVSGEHYVNKETLFSERVLRGADRHHPQDTSLNVPHPESISMSPNNLLSVMNSTGDESRLRSFIKAQIPAEVIDDNIEPNRTLEVEKLPTQALVNITPMNDHADRESDHKRQLTDHHPLRRNLTNALRGAASRKT